MDSTLVVNFPTTETPPLCISLLGSFSLTLNGNPINSFRSNKARALLAYLALARSQPILRTTLTDLLWPGYTEQSARTSFRQVLADLRKIIAPFDLLETDYQTVRLNLDPSVIWSDALMFEQLVVTCQRHSHLSIARCAACQARIHQAVALYQGAFLEHFPAIDSPPFTAWRQAQIAHFAALFVEMERVRQKDAAPLGNLPTIFTPLIGRTDELAQLTKKVQHPVYRCLTLVGPGGIGKSRLALALGKEVQTYFPEGVWLVELAALPPFLIPPAETGPRSDESALLEQLYDHMATTISIALGLTLQGAVRPVQQLADYLCEKEILLILDNFEHLSAGAAFILLLLQDAPGVRVVVTSRHLLELQAQQVFRVSGLSLPTEEAMASLSMKQLAQDYAGVQLFIERAENTLGNFVLDAENMAAVVSICRAVEGSPWGIGLAAALLDKQSPSAIAEAISANYAELQVNFLDLPERQRSAQAVFLTSWRLLTVQEAQTLARSAVFRGGFTLATAQRIAGATADNLQALVNKFLLHRTEAGRYTMHELVRHFADIHLATDAKLAG